MVVKFLAKSTSFKIVILFCLLSHLARSKKMGDLPSCIFWHFCIALLFLVTQKQNRGNFRIACEELGRRDYPTRITILMHPTKNQKNCDLQNY